MIVVYSSMITGLAATKKCRECPEAANGSGVRWPCPRCVPSSHLEGEREMHVALMLPDTLCARSWFSTPQLTIPPIWGLVLHSTGCPDQPIRAQPNLSHLENKVPTVPARTCVLLQPTRLIHSTLVGGRVQVKCEEIACGGPGAGTSWLGTGACSSCWSPSEACFTILVC